MPITQDHKFSDRTYQLGFSEALGPLRKFNHFRQRTEDRRQQNDTPISIVAVDKARLGRVSALFRENCWEKAYLTALPQLGKDERDAMVILDAMTAQMEVLEKHGHLRREEDVEEEGEESSASDSDEEKRRERREGRYEKEGITEGRGERREDRGEKVDDR